jgi:16S rRNA (guanine(966)-N(2))-methyltransferase RsmD
MSNIRIIGGTARGRKLLRVPGDSTRPIMDRAKEALFNILGRDIEGAAFLDVFSGTGAVGIEALSRGAEFVQLNDMNRRAIETIHRNLEIEDFKERSTVTRLDAFHLLSQIPAQPFDFVFVAPPQYKKMWSKALQKIDANPKLLLDDSWVIVQIDPKEHRELPLEKLTEIEQRRYGNTLLVFYELK